MPGQTRLTGSKGACARPRRSNGGNLVCRWTVFWPVPDSDHHRNRHSIGTWTAVALQPCARMSLTALGFLGIYVLGLVLAFARHPSFGLLSYVWAFYNLPPSRWWGSELPDVRWSLVAAGVTAVALIVRGAFVPRIEGRPAWIRHGGNQLLLLFVAWMWLETAWAVAPDRHIDGAMLYTKYAVLSFVLYGILTDAQRLERFAWVHVLGCFLWGYTGFMTGVSGRWESVLGPGIDDSNVLGFHLVTGLSFAGFLFLTVSGPRRWLALGAIPFILNGIILTASRSTILGLAAAAVAALFAAPRSRRLAVGASLALGVVLLLALARDDLFWNRAFSIGETREAEMDASAASRFTIFRANWQMALDYPFGAGHLGNEELSPDYVAAEALSRGRRSAHNTWMAVLVDEGFPGLALYASMYAWVFVRLMRLRRGTRSGVPLPVAGVCAAVACGLAAFMVAGQFLNLFKAEVVFWMLALVPVLEALASSAYALDNRRTDLAGEERSWSRAPVWSS